MDVRSEMISFLADGHKRHIPTWCSETQKQIERLKKAGLQNFKLQDARQTDHAQYWLYIPDSLNGDEKKCLESLLSETNFDCEKSMRIWES